MPVPPLPSPRVPHTELAVGDARTPTVPVHRLDSHTLFAGAREVHILHGGAVYRLKRTALGKLILTK